MLRAVMGKKKKIISKLFIHSTYTNLSSDKYVEIYINNKFVRKVTGDEIPYGYTEKLCIEIVHNIGDEIKISSKAGYASGYLDGKFMTGKDYFDIDYVFVATGVHIFDLDADSRQPCLAKGTLILMSDMSYKKIENITYKDLIRVWNFDEGKFDVAKPLWIARPGVSEQYNLLKFSDGTELRTIYQHRIFNEGKSRFTRTMESDTEIGDITVNEKLERVRLVSKEVVYEPIEYYNVVTDWHINLFSNTVLTSNNFNNIYPIADMKFDKSGGVVERNMKEFDQPVKDYFYGMRINECRFDAYYVNKYIAKMKHFEL
nr:MAG TPA: Hint [Bacteriophage sp.]